MLGLSYGEIFLLLGATAALIGPKDLPLIARTAGRLAGRAIGYVQMARGHFDNVMQQGQVSQVHKELQDTIAQLEAIRYEIRSISLVNPGPLTRRLDYIEPKPNEGNSISQRIDEEHKPAMTSIKDYSSPTTGLTNIHRQDFSSPTTGLTNIHRQDFSSPTTGLTNIHSQATAYAKLAESESIRSGSFGSSEDGDTTAQNVGLLSVLPVSAESSGLLPKPSAERQGSDIILEAILEAEVARNAKDFFSHPQNQIPSE